MTHRRDLLLRLAGGMAASLIAAPARLMASEAKETGLGIVLYCCGLRQRAQRSRGETDLGDPLNFLEHCHRLGAGGIQAPLGIRDQTYTSQLCTKAEACGMFIEGIGRLPSGNGDLDRFDAEVRTAKQSGAAAIRVVIIPGRRYERFDSADEFRQFAQHGKRALEMAEPIAAKHRVRLAVENHKDQRVPERLELLKRISSRHVGACVDTGNSFALLEDTIEVVRAYAPWAHSVHLKDQAVRQCEDGFLFGDVPLGEGFLDLAQMVQILRRAKPGIHFSLELITRDPLCVPCLTEKYWTTFQDIPARDLARTLRTVRDHASVQPLPGVSHLTLDEQVAREDDNLRKSLAYARDHLQIGS